MFPGSRFHLDSHRGRTISEPFDALPPSFPKTRSSQVTKLLDTCVRASQTAMASAMFLKDGTTLRSSAIRELSFEKHADTPERAEAPSRSLELHVTNPRRKDDCGGRPAIEAQTLLPRDLILALQGALRPSAAHVLRLRRVQLLAGSWGNVACGWKMLEE